MTKGNFVYKNKEVEFLKFQVASLKKIKIEETKIVL